MRLKSCFETLLNCYCLLWTVTCLCRLVTNYSALCCGCDAFFRCDSEQEMWLSVRVCVVCVYEARKEGERAGSGEVWVTAWCSACSVNHMCTCGEVCVCVYFHMCVCLWKKKRPGGMYQAARHSAVRHGSSVDLQEAPLSAAWTHTHTQNTHISQCSQGLISRPWTPGQQPTCTKTHDTSLTGLTSLLCRGRKHISCGKSGSEFKLLVKQTHFYHTRPRCEKVCPAVHVQWLPHFVRTPSSMNDTTFLIDCILHYIQLKSHRFNGSMV